MVGSKLLKLCILSFQMISGSMRPYSWLIVKCWARARGGSGFATWAWTDSAVLFIDGRLGVRSILSPLFFLVPLKVLNYPDW